MPKYKVYLQQYVEKVAVVEVEAVDEHEARTEALYEGHKAEWVDGDDAYVAEVYQVDDEAGLVWSR